MVLDCFPPIFWSTPSLYDLKHSLYDLKHSLYDLISEALPVWFDFWSTPCMIWKEFVLFFSSFTLDSGDI